jgi:hypothetical protein
MMSHNESGLHNIHSAANRHTHPLVVRVVSTTEEENSAELDAMQCYIFVTLYMEARAFTSRV